MANSYQRNTLYFKAGAVTRYANDVDVRFVLIRRMFGKDSLFCWLGFPGNERLGPIECAVRLLRWLNEDSLILLPVCVGFTCLRIRFVARLSRQLNENRVYSRSSVVASRALGERRLAFGCVMFD